MAEGLSQREVRPSLEELKREITCAVCQGVYRRPKLLSCSHYYCFSCIENMASLSRVGAAFVCPECRQETVFPAGGVAGLQSAFFVERMKRAYSDTEERMGALTDVVGSTVRLVCDMATTEDNIASEEAKVERQKDEVCASIQQSFDKLKSVLDQRKAELLDKVNGLAREKKEALAAQKKVLKAARTEVHSLVWSLESNVGRMSDEHLKNIRTDLQRKLEEGKQRYFKLLHDNVVTSGEFFLSPDSGRNSLGSVSLQLSPALVKFKIFESRELCQVQDPWGIAINGRDQLVVCDGDNNDSGRGRVVLFERNGRKVGEIECEQFIDPRGVAVGQDNSIFVTDIAANCLFKFSPTGILLKTVRSSRMTSSVRIFGDQLFLIFYDRFEILDFDLNAVSTVAVEEGVDDAVQGPDGIYVLTKDGKVRVYSCSPPNAQLLRTMTLPVSGWDDRYYTIASDARGHIYVGDGENGVYGYESSGVCLGHIDVCCPCGIAVHNDGEIYVCLAEGTVVVVYPRIAY